MTTTTKKKPAAKKKARNNGNEERREALGMLEKFLGGLGAQLGGGKSVMIRVMQIGKMQVAAAGPMDEIPGHDFAGCGPARKMEMVEHAPVVRHFFASFLHSFEQEPGGRLQIMMGSGEKILVMESAEEVAALAGIEIAANVSRTDK